jgi:hypothetical protein
MNRCESQMCLRSRPRQPELTEFQRTLNGGSAETIGLAELGFNEEDGELFACLVEEGAIHL